MIPSFIKLSIMNHFKPNFQHNVMFSGETLKQKLNAQIFWLDLSDSDRCQVTGDCLRKSNLGEDRVSPYTYTLRLLTL